VPGSRAVVGRVLLDGPLYSQGRGSLLKSLLTSSSNRYAVALVKEAHWKVGRVLLVADPSLGAVCSVIAVCVQRGGKGQS
jgi:hypothetical protein